MEFNSIAFLFVFLPVFMAVFWLLRPEARNGYYLLTGLIFYAWGEGEGVFLLLAFIAANYAVGTAVARLRAGPARKTVFLAGLVFDVGFLFYFKYAAFFLRTLGLAGGGSLPDPTRLPLGISFFTLAALSFLIDVYRRTVPFDPHPLRFGLFLSFFPKMATGPITPYRTLAPALAEPRRMDAADFALGARRFLLGFAKKQLIADALAGTANNIFAVPRPDLTAGLAWLGLVAYTLQIYFDFSSYTDMALGLGRMLGLRLPENFNYPYASKSIQEFWKRWHISLSQWLQYYLFLPIAYAVSRRIKGDRWLRIRADYWAYAGGGIITFLICGLWHGANWTFVAWGAYHGLFLIAEQAGLGKFLKKRLPPPARWAYCQLLVMVGWVFFRSLTLSDAGAYLGALFGLGSGNSDVYYPGLYLHGQALAALAVGIIGSFPVVPALSRAWQGRLSAFRTGEGRLMRAVFIFGGAVLENAVAAALFLGAVLALIGGTFHPFIYARF